MQPKHPKTQILKKRRCIKTLQKKNDQEGYLGNIGMKRKSEKKTSKLLVYETQRAKHGLRQAWKKKTKATQTEFETFLNDAVYRYIDTIFRSKMKEAMGHPPIYFKYEEPLVQFANYGHEPVTGRLYAWEDVADLPKPFDPYWMMVLGNASPNDDNSLCLSLADGMDLSTIDTETELYPEPIVNHSSGPRRCDWIYEILRYLSLFGMIFAVLDYFHDMLNSEQPLSIWEWSFRELGNFLRTYLYIDMYNIN